MHTFSYGGFIMSRDPYYYAPDGYDAYQSRELLKREYKDGKVYSTYKCSNLGGEVDIFTTICDPIDEKNDSKLKYLWNNLIPICGKICFAILIILATIVIGGFMISGYINWILLILLR